jgi:hypothetical protein
MKTAFIAWGAAVALGLLGFTWWFITDQVSQAADSSALVAEGPPSVSSADAGIMEDDDAGAEDAEPVRWIVRFADPAIAGTLVSLGSAPGFNGGQVFLYMVPASDMRFAVTAYPTDSGTDATGIIRVARESAVGEGIEASPEELLVFGEHSWVGCTLRKETDEGRLSGRFFASVDTTARGALLSVVSVWPEAREAEGLALFTAMLQSVEVRREE